MSNYFEQPVVTIGSSAMGRRPPTARFGRVGLGAVQQTSPFNYRGVAEPLANASLARTPSATIVVVALDADGKNPSVIPFSNAEMATDAFEDVIAKPGARAYVGSFDRGGVRAEQFFAVTQFVETRFTFEKLKSIAPVLVGGAVLIAGVVWFSRSGKKAKSPRRRRSANWRRRIVTTWR